MRKTVGVLIPTLLLTGCDLLLGPADVPSPTVGAGWEASPVVAGSQEILGLDLAVDGSGGLVTSYLIGGDQLRLGRLEAGVWTHTDGPTVTGTTGSGFTRLAVGPSGQAAILYPSGGDVYTVLADPDFESPVALSTVTAALRDSVKPRPAYWNHVNSDIAYGPDGILRVAVGAGLETPQLLYLWLFRFDGDWDLGIVGGSEQINGAVRLLASTGGVEHLFFEAGSQGRYWWWRPGKGWQSRLALPNTQGQPYQIALRSDDTSVLGTRQSNSVRVAVENYNPTQDQYRWESVEAAEHTYLNWANTDLVLDDQGLPGVMYVVGPFPNQVFQVWFAKMQSDGIFALSLVAGNLTLPTFSPFNARMVRDPSGTVHVLLTTGVATGQSGGSTVWEYRLMHYTFEDLESR